MSGVFTEGSLEQLRSLGFHVLYFPYDTLVAAFAEEAIDVAFDETTPDAAFQKCIRKIEKTSRRKMERIKNHLVAANQEKLEDFMASLSQRLDRMVEKVVIIPLYGRSNEFSTIDDAMEFLDRHPIGEDCADFRKYEVLIAFSNGDRLEGSFKDKAKVREFLQFVAKQ